MARTTKPRAAARTRNDPTRFAHVSTPQLLAEWAKTVRRLGRAPSFREYHARSRSAVALRTRVQRWSRVSIAFHEWAARQPRWRDVIAVLTTGTTHAPADAAEPIRCHRARIDQPIYGTPEPIDVLLHHPDSEIGVVVAFALLARALGYRIQRMRRAFPDCEALRCIGLNQWQRVRIEFEYESRNFERHGHDPKGCEIIVCWRHNWPDYPRHLEIVELQSILAER